MSDLHPKHLGHKSILTPEQIDNPRSILDTFPNPSPGRDYEIKFVFPEFTSMCPVTGQPDFATITVTYTPADKCVEMKSLKLYYLAFRNKGVFYEKVANQVMDDLIAALSPKKMTVVADFAARGGTVGVVTCQYPSP
jgi:7-cyano-7-deazaguanine reductase